MISLFLLDILFLVNFNHRKPNNLRGVDLETFLYEIKKERLNNLLKETKQNNMAGSLWLADLKKLFEEHNFNLGYKRGNYPARRLRPAVVVGRQNSSGMFKVVFLTKSKRQHSKPFELKHCNVDYCTKNFAWLEISYILKYNNKFIFLFNDRDIKELMYFCGICKLDYLKELIDRDK